MTSMRRGKAATDSERSAVVCSQGSVPVSTRSLTPSFPLSLSLSPPPQLVISSTI